MKHLALILLCFGTPLTAQDAPADGTADESVDQGFSLMEEGAKLLLKGLMSEMEPALDEMGKALSGVEPALKELQPKLLELLALVDDLTNYQAPERLQNGDILIRRKPGAPHPPALPVPDSLPEPTSPTDL